jgi:hypothetical protein
MKTDKKRWSVVPMPEERVCSYVSFLRIDALLADATIEDTISGGIQAELYKRYKYSK